MHIYLYTYLSAYLCTFVVPEEKSMLLNVCESYANLLCVTTFK